MTLIIFQALEVMSLGKETAPFLPLESPPTHETTAREALILGRFCKTVFGELRFSFA